MQEKNRILALIDGFNYYHPLNVFQKNKRVCVKWLNYYSLVESILQDDDDKDSFEVIYYSAIAYYRTDGAAERHKIYIKALKEAGVEIVLGHFQIKNKPKCKLCKYKDECNPDKTFEEKSTDVNIALTIMEYAYKDEFDKCFIFSTDNDFAPAIKKVKGLFPEKKIIICPPPAKKYYLDKLTRDKQAEIRYINWTNIIENQFSDDYKGLINPWQIKKEYAEE